MRNSRDVLLSISFGMLLGVSAIAHAGSSVKLSWSIPTTRENGQALATSELTGYELYYTTDDPNVTGTVNVSGGTTSSYTVQNLAGGNYHFAMSAIDAGGLKSKLSTVADITLAASTAVPSVPTITTTTASSTTISVSWSIPKTRVDGTPLSVSELAGYKVNLFRGYTLITSVAISGGNVSNYVISNVSSGTYAVVLMAVDTAGKNSSLAHQLITVK